MLKSPAHGPQQGGDLQGEELDDDKVMRRVMTKVKTRVLKMWGAMGSLPVFMPVKLLSARYIATESSPQIDVLRGEARGELHHGLQQGGDLQGEELDDDKCDEW